MKSMACAIFESSGPFAKFPRTIFFNTKAGISQKLNQEGKKKNRKKAPVVSVQGITCTAAQHGSARQTNNVPVCCPCLVKDGGITEGVAQNEGMHSGRFVRALGKLLCQKAPQRSPKYMHL